MFEHTEKNQDKNIEQFATAKLSIAFEKKSHRNLIVWGNSRERGKGAEGGQFFAVFLAQKL